MAAQIDNTVTATQKGAPNQVQNQHKNQSSHGAGNDSRNARRISNFPKINRHKIAGSGSGVGSILASSLEPPASKINGHAVPSIFVVTPAASTKVQKLMGTLSEAISLPAGQAGIGILPALRPVEASGATAARRGGRSEACLTTGRDLSAPICYSKVTVFLVDTPVEIENGFSPSESTTSPKLSRYTFDMFRERKKRSEKEVAIA